MKINVVRFSQGSPDCHGPVYGPAKSEEFRYCPGQGPLSGVQTASLAEDHGGELIPAGKQCAELCWAS